MPPAVDVRELRVVRGRAVVLDDLALRVAPGTVVGVLGPSGCGKTTLMRCLLGLQRPAAGRVEVLGLPAGDPALRTRVGYATQQASVYDDLTVQENAQFFADLLGLGAPEVDRVIESVDLGPTRGRLVRTLSGGQRSRVSLAVAMLGDPELLVLDEPTVGLDPLLREQLWALFTAAARRGRTLLVSSHVMDEAERCDLLVLLRAGRLLACEPPAALLGRTGARSMEQAFLELVRAG